MSARHSRRTLFGAGAASLLLAATAAGEAKAHELDGELIAACERYEWLEAEAGRLSPLSDRVLHSDTHATGQAQLERVFDQQHELVDFIACTPARTPEGMQAKAATAMLLIGKWELETSHELSIAASLLRELTGRAGA